MTPKNKRSTAPTNSPRAASGIISSLIMLLCAVFALSVGVGPARAGPADANRAIGVAKGLIAQASQSLGTKLRANLQSAAVPPAMAAPPTISKSTTSALASSVVWSDPKLSLLCARWIQDGANPRAKPITVDYVGDGSSLFGNSGCLYFESDAPKIELDGLFDGYRVFVDELDGKGWQQAGTIISADAGTRYFTTIDFTAAATPRKDRIYRVDMGGSSKLYAVKTAATDSVYPYVRLNPIKAILVGDSFSEGTGATYGYLDGYAIWLGKFLGIEDFTVSGSGGTGIIQTNGTRVGYKDRVQADVVAQHPDLVFIQCSQNDKNSFTNAQVQAALVQTVGTIRAGLPNAKITIIGVWNTTGSSTQAASLNAALASTAASLGLDYVDWYSFITGTGRVGATVGDGNADFYVSTDSTHPTDAGHFYRAKRLITLFRSVIQGWSANTDEHWMHLAANDNGVAGLAAAA